MKKRKSSDICAFIQLELKDARFYRGLSRHFLLFFPHRKPNSVSPLYMHRDFKEDPIVYANHNKILVFTSIKYLVSAIKDDQALIQLLEQIETNPKPNFPQKSQTTRSQSDAPSKRFPLSI